MNMEPRNIDDFGLNKNLAMVEEEVSRTIDETLSATIIVEVTRESQGSSTANHFAEDFMKKFMERNTQATPMKEVITTFLKDYLETGDLNQYVASYNTILLRANEFGLSPIEVLGVLQALFRDMQSLSDQHHRHRNKVSQVDNLLAEDCDILEYIGGFLLRKISYHPTTTAEEKQALMKLKASVRVGSIAHDRNREGVSGDGLWGIKESLLRFLEMAEKYFRRRVQCDAQNICIDSNFCKQFMDENLSSICLFDSQTQNSNVTEMILQKITKKFMHLRAHAYAKHLTKKMVGKKGAVAQHGLRKNLAKTVTNSV